MKANKKVRVLHGCLLHVVAIIIFSEDKKRMSGGEDTKFHQDKCKLMER